MKWFAPILLLILSFACAGGKIITVSNIQVYERYWNKAVESLGKRASFDLNCPADQLEFKLFRKFGRYPTEVGVTGFIQGLRYATADEFATGIEPAAQVRAAL